MDSGAHSDALPRHASRIEGLEIAFTSSKYGRRDMVCQALVHLDVSLVPAPTPLDMLIAFGDTPSKDQHKLSKAQSATFG